MRMKWKLKGPKMIQFPQRGRLKKLDITKGVVCDIVCQHIDEPLGSGPKATKKQMVKKTPNVHFGP
jgi:hypothetical protein